MSNSLDSPEFFLVPFGNTAIPSDVFQYLFGFLRRTPAVLSSVGSVSSLWHRAVLLSWGELVVKLADRRTFPTELLKGLRVLKIEQRRRSGMLPYGVDPCFRDFEDGDIMHSKVFHDLARIGLLSEIHIGFFQNQGQMSGMFSQLAVFSSASMPLTPTEIVNDLIQGSPLLKFLMVQSLQIIYGGGGQGASLSNQVGPVIRFDELIHTFPNVRNCNIFREGMLLGRNTCWRDTLQEIAISRSQMKRENLWNGEKWGHFRKLWPHLQKIQFALDFDTHEGCLRHFLQGIEAHGVGVLSELFLVMTNTQNWSQFGISFLSPYRGAVRNVDVFNLFFSDPACVEWTGLYQPALIHNQIGPFVGSVSEFHLEGMFPWGELSNLRDVPVPMLVQWAKTFKMEPRIGKKWFAQAATSLANYFAI